MTEQLDQIRAWVADAMPEVGHHREVCVPASWWLPILAVVDAAQRQVDEVDCDNDCCDTPLRRAVWALR